MSQNFLHPQLYPACASSKLCEFIDQDTLVQKCHMARKTRRGKDARKSFNLKALSSNSKLSFCSKLSEGSFAALKMELEFPPMFLSRQIRPRQKR